MLSTNSLTTDSKPNGKAGGKGVNPDAVTNNGVGPGKGGAGGSGGYIDGLRSLLRSRLVYSDDAGNPSVQVRITVLPDGSIQNVEVIKSSGDAAYADASNARL